MLHNHLIIFLFRRYIHSHGYLYKWIMYDRISSYIDIVHPSSQTSSLLRLLRYTLKNTFMISVTPKSGTTRSWGGATHKLKPSPFHPTPVLWITPCIVPSLNSCMECNTGAGLHGHVSCDQQSCWSRSGCRWGKRAHIYPIGQRKYHSWDVGMQPGH